MVRWPFRGQTTRTDDETILPPTRPAATERLAATELIDLLRWHIDRYDRLRSSTSSRASILLSGNSALLAGMILLVNYRLQLRDAHPIGYLDIPFFSTILTTVVLTFGSIGSCINAIATRKTVRTLHKGEIPNRFLFNWGDTVRSVDGYTSFAEHVIALDHTAVVGHAIAELWTDILQHSRRHRYLRSGVSLFRYGVISFSILALLSLLIVS